MSLRLIRDYLDKERVKYTVLTHSPAFTAQEIAAASHIPGHRVAKCVILSIDGELAIAVLPASSNVDLDLLGWIAGAERVELATESEFRDRFPDCETGAMPPLGNLYGMPVYVDEELATEETITFNGGTHTELIQMAYRDFERLVRPKIIEFARPRI